MSSIPLPALQVRPPQPGEGPLEMYAKVMSLKNLQQRQQVQQEQLKGLSQENQIRGQEMAEDAAVRQAIQEAGGDVRKALPKIMQIAPLTGGKIQKSVVEWDTADNTAKKAIIDRHLAQFKGLGELAGTVTDQPTYENAIKQATQSGFLEESQAAQMLATPYNPATVKGWQTQAMTVMEQLGQSKKALDEQTSQQTLKKTTAEATMAGQEAELPIEERYGLKRGRIPVPGVDVPYPGDVEAQKNRIAAAGAERKLGDQDTIETTAGDYLTEANGDANKALAQLEKDVQAKDVNPMLRRYAVRIRFRIRERVRPGVPRGQRDRVAEILGEAK